MWLMVGCSVTASSQLVLVPELELLVELELLELELLLLPATAG